MKQIYLFAFIVLSLSVNAQIVDIPDANFKNALINTQCVYADGDWDTPSSDADTNNDGEIQESEAAAIYGLDVSSQNIASLQGIEFFTGLWFLNCSNNQLAVLDTQANLLMRSLNCSHNLLISLIVYFPPQMEYENDLNASDNLLASFTLPDSDFYQVNLTNNQLTEVNAQSGAFTQYLYLNGNAFTTFVSPNWTQWLSLSNCPNLTSVSIFTDAATITNNPQLLSAKLGSCGHYYVNNNASLQSIDIKDGYDCFIAPDWPGVHLDFTNNPSLLYVCLDDLGNWYYEGEWFFQPELWKVMVDPGVTLTYYCDFTPGGGYNTVTGTVTIDSNGDGCSVDDQAASNVQIKMTQGTNNVGTTFSDILGNYTSYVSSQSQTLTPQFSSPYYIVSPASYTTAFSGTGNTETVNFCITPNGAHNDLDVTLNPLTPARPGFNATYNIHYRNKGTEAQSAVISLAFEDDTTDLVSALPGVSSQTENSMTWNLANIAPFETGDIVFELNLNSPMETPAVNIGDVLDFTVSITGQTDETPNDNTYVLNQIIVGSVDPNDKIVSRENIGTSQLGEYLYYTVRFQNTGTFYAENVAVRDVLSKNLDLSTLEVVATSHLCRQVLTPENDATNFDKLEFFFENINLPASQDDEPASHGYVVYKIKPKSTLTIGNTITNQAEIYFDYNFPIVTNMVTTTVTSLGNPEFADNDFVLYPNPAKNSISVQTDAIVKNINIYNALGQLVKTASAQTTIDISELSRGSYIVQIISDKGKANKKLIKL
jgi:uncharacterized repeat protein (TIGR01451 family)